MVGVESSQETVMFATASLGAHWDEKRFVSGFNYIRSLMIGASIGSFSATNIKAGYLVSPGKWRKDFAAGLGVDYQIGGFNFGQIPMLGVLIFAQKPTEFYDFFAEIDVAGLYTSTNSVYEIKNNFRAEAKLSRFILPNVIFSLGFEWRDFIYRVRDTSGGYSQLTLSALALGLGISY